MGQRAEAYIVDAIRTPTGKRRGSLATVHGADLGGSQLDGWKVPASGDYQTD